MMPRSYVRGCSNGEGVSYCPMLPTVHNASFIVHSIYKACAWIIDMNALLSTDEQTSTQSRCLTQKPVQLWINDLLRCCCCLFFFFFVFLVQCYCCLYYIRQTVNAQKTDAVSWVNKMSLLDSWSFVV